MKKPKLVMVSSASGDWEGLYVDGVLKAEGHRVRTDEVLAILGIKIEEKECEEDWLESRGEFPVKLSEVKF